MQSRHGRREGLDSAEYRSMGGPQECLVECLKRKWRTTAYTYTPIPTDIYDNETVTSMRQWVAFSNRMSQREILCVAVIVTAMYVQKKLQWITQTLNTKFIRSMYTQLNFTLHISSCDFNFLYFSNIKVCISIDKIAVITHIFTHYHRKHCIG